MRTQGTFRGTLALMICVLAVLACDPFGLIRPEPPASAPSVPVVTSLTAKFVAPAKSTYYNELKSSVS